MAARTVLARVLFWGSGALGSYLFARGTSQAGFNNTATKFFRRFEITSLRPVRCSSVRINFPLLCREPHCTRRRRIEGRSAIQDSNAFSADCQRFQIERQLQTVESFPRHLGEKLVQISEGEAGDESLSANIYAPRHRLGSIRNDPDSFHKFKGVRALILSEEL